MVAKFIIGLLAFLFGFGFFIAWVMGKLNNRIPQRHYNWIERAIIAGIILGIVMMFQPWHFTRSEDGLALYLFAMFSILAFIVWGHARPLVPVYGFAMLVAATLVYVAWIKSRPHMPAYGFLVLLGSTLAYIVWSHVTPYVAAFGEDESDIAVLELSPDDRAALDSIQARYGVLSDDNAIRMALRLLADAEGVQVTPGGSQDNTR